MKEKDLTEILQVKRVQLKSVEMLESEPELAIA
jgi:hypothetical protein